MQPDPEPSFEAVRAAYGERLAAREAALALLERRDTHLSRARVACFVAALVMVMVGWRLNWSWMWLLLPLGLFLVLVAIHGRVVADCELRRRAVDYYREALERMAGRWAGKGTSATDLCAGDHPYAADLDLFGSGSLFELLCRARTRAGEEQLAAWMTCHAEARVSVETIVARQRSVQALIGELELREDLAVLGAAARAELRPAALIEWGRAPALLSPTSHRRLRVAGVIVPAAAVLGSVVWAWGGGPWLLVVAALAALAFQRAHGDALSRVVGPVDRVSHELTVLAAVLERIAASEYEDSRLVELRRVAVDESASEIRRLRRLFGWYEAQRNAVLYPFALLMMWGSNFGTAIERWRVRHGPRIAVWIGVLGEFEALVSIATYTYEHPDQPFPQLVEIGEDGPVFEGEALGHPLLDRKLCVTNDLRLVAPVRAHVVSGSNMSGKSTFLRTVGCNAVLAMLGAPVRAARLRLTPLRIGATLRVQDSLHEGASRFWAELARLRTITEQAAADPTLFLLDEIFHGTNSHDRRIGAEALLRTLVERGALGLMTTHDLALAEAAEALAPAATNVHFRDELVDGRLIFDYRMYPGVVRRSNALALMRSVGLEV